MRSGEALADENPAIYSSASEKQKRNEGIVRNQFDTSDLFIQFSSRAEQIDHDPNPLLK